MTAWDPKNATNRIRLIANSDNLTISYKRHATERLNERGLIVSDIIYVLKNGFVYTSPIAASREGFNKYAMDSKSPNSGNREIRVVVIPEEKANYLKIVSVMWVDEKSTIAGSIVGEENE